MDGIEGLGSFYLGKPYDAEAKKLEDGYVLYDSKDLTTHAVCVGMTGSGKTGLCVGVIEEAALDGVPVDRDRPQGRPRQPDADLPGAAPRGLPALDQRGRRGQGRRLAGRLRRSRRPSCGARASPTGARTARASSACATRPTSRSTRRAATPACPSRCSARSRRRPTAPTPRRVGDQIGAIATGLLALLGIDADPIKSREHILISSILGAAWANGQALDIAALIAQIQQPPFAKIGVLDLDSFYPQKDRFELALALNNLLAAPGFQLWMQGVPLDVGQLLRSDAGKPRVAIFSIAHLSDAERMFFVTLLLNAVLAWMRGQSGTTSLRALLYMDEIFGYFPPTAEPPSKKPLLTLLKQARAFGLGVLLATQNPVDLDYKGLSNAGTWLIGRLQTDQDKQRVLDGLEGASGQGGLDRAQLEKLISALGNRVFLLNNVHENAPEVFQTRWTMSYLRGPLSRPQIASLMAPRQGRAAAAGRRARTGGRARGRAARPRPRRAAAAAPPCPRPPRRPRRRAASRPAYLPLRGAAPAGASLAYVPMLIGTARVRLLDTKAQVDEAIENARLAAFADGPIAIDWTAAADLAVAAADLESAPRDGAAFHDLPAPARDAKAYARWSKDYADWLYQTQTVQLFRSPSQKLVSHAGRVRGRLPRAARPGRARGPRLEGRRAAREVRRQGRGAAVRSCTRRSRRSTARRTRSAARACRPPSRSPARSSAASSGASRSRSARSRASRAAPGGSRSSATTSSAPRRT